MKNWFLSLNAAIVLSLLALLSNLWRGFLDAMLVLPPDFGDAGLMQLAAILFTALFAGWSWAIFAAWGGSRRGLAAAFAVNAVVLVAIPASWLLYYCPAECRAGAGIFNLANTLNLVFGLLAALALGLQFRREPRLAAETARQG
jgi:hypothetical protein